MPSGPIAHVVSDARLELDGLRLALRDEGVFRDDVIE